MKLVRITERPVISDSNPRHAAVGHFNKDVHIDLVVANSGSDNIGIRIGYGNGTFSAQTFYSTGLGSLPNWVLVQDFNNDTFQDIVVANYGTNNIGIFFGYGNESFSEQHTFSLGTSRPISVAIADFNHDTHLDLVVLSNSTFNVSLLLGFGNGSFYTHTSYYMGHDSSPASFAVTDVNNDQQSDIVVVNYGTSNLVILLADRNGIFSTKIYSTGANSQPTSVTVGDFNSDNNIDIAIVGSALDIYGIFMGHGDGTFDEIKTYSTGYDSNPQFIVAGYFNKDKKVDLIVANANSDNIIVLIGFGNGTFFIEAAVWTGYNSKPCAIVLGDFDHDYITDIVVINNGTNSIFVLRSYITYLADNQTSYKCCADFLPDLLTLDDFNNDKHLDIMTVNIDSGNIELFIGSSNGRFHRQHALSFDEQMGKPDLIASGDFNNDHLADIAVTITYRNDIHIYLGNGKGHFRLSSQHMMATNSISSVIIVGDFNGDKNCDILVGSDLDETLAMFLGTGHGTFKSPIIYETPGQAPAYISKGDFNNDDILDFLVLSDSGLNISIYFGNNDGKFQINVFINTSDYYVCSFVVGDLNKDLKSDIVVVMPDVSMVGIYLGKGDGKFSAMLTYPIDIFDTPQFAVLNDFNHDRIIDIAVLNTWHSTIYVLFGRGDGTFPTKNVLTMNDVSESCSIVSADFNRDGYADLVVSNRGSNDITVILLQYKPVFNNQTTYLQEASPHPTAVALADFNNDNHMDIALVNANSNNMQILLGYNNGSFMDPMTYPTGTNSHPQHVTVADFNKDNHSDIAVINSWNNLLMIFIVSEKGTVNSLTSHFIGSKYYPNAVAVSDFNKDGWIDVVVTNRDVDNIGVFLGYDYPTFKSNHISLRKYRSIPYYAIVADFNNDFYWDIAVACKNSNNLAVFLGRGDGTFQGEKSNNAISLDAPTALATADFNRDNYLDVAIVDHQRKRIRVLLGDGNGTFRTYLSIMPISFTATHLAVADFNNDDQQDIVVSNQYSHTLDIFLGKGNGLFEEPVSYFIHIHAYPIWVTVTDFNHDHNQDIAVANYIGSSIGVFLGFGNGSFDDVIVYKTGIFSGPCSLATGDLNGDTHMDIVVANKFDQDIDIFLGDGNGAFSKKATYKTGSDSELTSVTVNDLNNDGILDIIVTDFGNGKGNVGVFYGLGGGQFLVKISYPTGFNSYPSSVAIADFNGDNLTDYTVTNSNQNNIAIMLRSQAQPFGNLTTFSCEPDSRPHGVAVYDLNNDGCTDVIVANNRANNIGIFVGLGDGSFVAQQTYSTGIDSGPKSIAIGDIDRDGIADIIVANSIANNICILRGKGHGMFVLWKSYETGLRSDPSFIALADVNKDEHVDIVAAASGTNRLQVFNGIGSGLFSIAESYNFKYNAHPISIGIGDINNDSWLDAIIANGGSDGIEVLLQKC